MLNERQFVPESDRIPAPYTIAAKYFWKINFKFQNNRVQHFSDFLLPCPLGSVKYYPFYCSKSLGYWRFANKKSNDLPF